MTSVLQRSATLPGRALRALRREWFLKGVLASIDEQSFQEINARFRDEAPWPGHSKYLERRPWILEKLRLAESLRLHHSRPLRILDLGTGAGYFPLTCAFFGHSVVAVDLDEVEMYNRLMTCFGIDRRTWRVSAGVPLPDLDGPFDLVTGFQVCFNNHMQPDVWGPDEWRGFLSDIATNHLAPGGRVFLDLNAEPHGFYDAELEAFFRAEGAEVQGSTLRFQDLSHFRVEPSA